MPNYLVTGGAGFIGTNLVKTLLSEGHSVRVFDNYVGGNFPERHQKEAEYIVGDIRDKDALVKTFVGIDGIFHLAAVPRVSYSVEHPLETHDVNVNGTLNVLEAVRSAGVKRVIFASSSAALGDQPQYPVPETAVPKPISPYGLHKLVGENYCRLWSTFYGLETVSLRYFNIYGEYMDPNGAYALVVGKFMAQKKRGEPLTICGDGDYYRDYTHVQDVAKANILAMTSTNVGHGEVIEIGGGHPYSVNEVAALIGGATTNIPARAADMRFTQANLEKAKTLLGWESTITLPNGIAELKKIEGVE
ncbi:MAG: hypothetical protein A2821_03525 [Candidatus Magasanikbacteria bacterium RIFCSPHIGHO2_01_FULL_41_23]|uniref:NAD-dependent epimerase/dehydratase domain-containing protein n=1 Tax=Candidatus Magasanikbacteria bacterium RIFCSPLOWO2_01_FULL_40_15 TaxID=1798686 RepID=A0A1F6N211_9BACT|nr:MAG: hypothetical protein A2821_03525 [Candidatus Magasanikbacteria bacterium RIFCSPHIGHO2_01_FULL_41_23]OGH66621.1 MAG: hypothetical protein A3C66_03105 [Candidatus Magasanikbacteria bacterium RIFCSPHIGHO2_02_FULL_41_35]OGH74774.1 MAG: hypothetical protein A3F22_00890 [Candidatus Magasanikbacteria bacterium RIFCSPHIGHO2_12_FULL_41_16]OGH77750.1 MAG: hypothetical protein A2983_03865 [Candidatus Magasanikbacteria bacterium RIFCSPLOWO2_01_FULL_40_15]